jgi:hypothetical protein
MIKPFYKMEHCTVDLVSVYGTILHTLPHSSCAPPALPTSPVGLTCIIHGAAVGKITTGTPTEKISKLLTPLLNGNGSNTTSANATNARYLKEEGGMKYV